MGRTAKELPERLPEIPAARKLSSALVAVTYGIDVAVRQLETCGLLRAD
jgi:hypothetical protein